MNTKEIIIDNKKFILRPALDSDLDFTFNLLKDNMLELFIKNWGFWNEKSFEENFKKENIRIIEYENEPIGFIDFKFKKDCGYLNDIHLSESFKNNGLGTYLMKILEQETLLKGFKIIRLKTFKNNHATNLYNKLNYKSISEDDTSMIMEKEL